MTVLRWTEDCMVLTQALTSAVKFYYEIGNLQTVRDVE